MHTSFFSRAISLSVTTLALAACGGSDGDGGNKTSGSGGNTSGSGGSSGSLSEAQQTDFCDWYVDLLMDPTNVATMCKRTSVLAGADDGGTLEEQRASCATNADSCATTQSTRATYEMVCPTLFDGVCTATIDEIKACIDDQWAALRANVAGVPECSALTAEHIAQVQQPLAFGTPACITAATKCPSFFGGDDEPDEPDPASVVACNEACDAYNAQCGTDISCDCSILYTITKKETCDGLGVAYYECAKGGTFDCSDDFLPSASVECSSADYMTCSSIESVDCVRDESADDLLCKDAELPLGFKCVSTSPQTAGCEHKGGSFYCCPGAP